MIRWNRIAGILMVFVAVRLWMANRESIAALLQCVAHLCDPDVDIRERHYGGLTFLIVAFSAASIAKIVARSQRRRTAT